jgi:hypothetical protein
VGLLQETAEDLPFATEQACSAPAGMGALASRIGVARSSFTVMELRTGASCGTRVARGGISEASS